MWEEIFEYRYNNDGPRERTYLNYGGDPQTCRFCAKTTPGVTFKNDAHVIPAAFGNRTLYSDEECDNCNARFGSTIETDFANSMALVRGIARKRSRKGHNKIKPGGSDSFIKSGVGSDIVKVELNEGQDQIEVRDLGNNQFELSCHIPAYRPINVAKAIAKFSIMALPEAEYQDHLHIVEWLNGKQQWRPSYYRLLIPGTGMKDTIFSVKRRNDGIYDNLIVAFFYGVSIHVLALPDSKWNAPDTISLEDLVGPEYANLLQGHQIKEMGEEDVLSALIETLGMTAANMRQIDPDKMCEYLKK